MIANCAGYCRSKQREEMFFAFSKGSRGCLGKKSVHHCYFSTVRSTNTDFCESSLAMAEMKILLREVYSQCSTRISEHMDGDMEMADQIISSHPRGQTCKLIFERI